MSLQQIDVDTRETVAGVVRLLRRAAELVWLVLEIDGVGSPRQVLASGIDVAVAEARNLLPDATSIEGLCRSGMNQPISSNRLRTRVPDLVWEANTVSATDQRTVGELLADSDASRETFLDATFNDAPLRVRSWNQRAESAAELWAVLPSEPDSRPGRTRWSGRGWSGRRLA